MSVDDVVLPDSRRVLIFARPFADSMDHGLYDVTDLIKRVVVKVKMECIECDVRWAMWPDVECWVCGSVGYMVSPKDMETLPRLISSLADKIGDDEVYYL